MWAACKPCMIEAQWDPWPIPYSRSKLVFAVPSSPPSKLLFCLLWEMLLPRPAPGSAAAPRALSLPDDHCDRRHQTRAFRPDTTQREGQFPQMPTKAQMHVCNTTHCSGFRIFLIIHGTKRSTIKLVFH